MHDCAMTCVGLPWPSVRGVSSVRRASPARSQYPSRTSSVAYTANLIVYGRLKGWVAEELGENGGRDMTSSPVASAASILVDILAFFAGKVGDH